MMGFEHYDAWKSTAPVERETIESEDELAPLYRVMFQYPGYGANAFTRARFERLDGKGLCSRWTLVCSGRGAEEPDAVKALRENLRDLRSRVRGRRERGEPELRWRLEHEVEGLHSW